MTDQTKSVDKILQQAITISEKQFRKLFDCMIYIQSKDWNIGYTQARIGVEYFDCKTHLVSQEDRLECIGTYIEYLYDGYINGILLNVYPSIVFALANLPLNNKADNFCLHTLRIFIFKDVLCMRFIDFNDSCRKLYRIDADSVDELLWRLMSYKKLSKQ